MSMSEQPLRASEMRPRGAFSCVLYSSCIGWLKKGWSRQKPMIMEVGDLFSLQSHSQELLNRENGIEEQILS
jgi:hypothetical protein